MAFALIVIVDGGAPIENFTKNLNHGISVYFALDLLKKINKVADSPLH
jgi:hypothetical protein